MQRSITALVHAPPRLGTTSNRPIARCVASPPLQLRPATESQRIFQAASPRAFSVLSFFTKPTQRRPRSSIPPPPPLPQAQIVRVGSDCALEYIDLAPRQSRDGHPDATLVLLHGAPGTYHDFKYLVPHVQQQLPSMRIIGINFPGFGGSSVDESRYFELLNAQRAAQLTYDALSHLVGSSENVFLVGHSFGGHAVLNLAALSVESAAAKGGFRVKGLVLLAAAGTRPHRVLRPRESEMFINALQRSPPAVQRILSSIIKVFYTKLLRFPSDFPASHFVAGILRAGTTDFETIRSHVAALQRERVPSLSAWSTNDEFMEDEIPIALAETLGSSKRLAFASAGHNIQKTRAEVVAIEMKQWVEQVLAEQASNTTQQVPIENRP